MRISANNNESDSIDFNIDSIENQIAMNCEKSIPEIQLENEFDKDDHLNSFRTPASKTILISEIPNILVDNKNPGEGKTPFSLINDDHCEELAHPYLFPTGKFGFKAEREVKLSPSKYFNQRLLNYTQQFSSDSDYIFFAHRVLQELNLRSKINIALKKVTNNDIAAGMLGQNFKQAVQNCIASDNAYKFMSTVKGTPAYWQHMLTDVLAMVKQLGIPSYL